MDQPRLPRQKTICQMGCQQATTVAFYGSPGQALQRGSPEPKQGNAYPPPLTTAKGPHLGLLSKSDERVGLARGQAAGNLKCSVSPRCLIHCPALLGGILLEWQRFCSADTSLGNCWGRGVSFQVPMLQAPGGQMCMMAWARCRGGNTGSWGTKLWLTSQQSVRTSWRKCQLLWVLEMSSHQPGRKDRQTWTTTCAKVWGGIRGGKQGGHTCVSVILGWKVLERRCYLFCYPIVTSCLLILVSMSKTFSFFKIWKAQKCVHSASFFLSPVPFCTNRPQFFLNASRDADGLSAVAHRRPHRCPDGGTLHCSAPWLFHLIYLGDHPASEHVFLIF